MSRRDRYWLVARTSSGVRIGATSNLTVRLIRQDLFGSGQVLPHPALSTRLDGADTVYISPSVIVVREADESGGVCDRPCPGAGSLGQLIDVTVPGSAAGSGGGGANEAEADNAASPMGVNFLGVSADMGPGGMLDVFA